MSPADAAVLTRFTLTNHGDGTETFELIADVEAMLVPYGLLGVKAKQFKFRQTEGKLIMETRSCRMLPLLPAMPAAQHRSAANIKARNLAFSSGFHAKSRPIRR